MAERSRAIGEEVELQSVSTVPDGWRTVIVVGIEDALEFSPRKVPEEPVSKPDDAEGDPRTLWVDFAAQDRRYKSWKSVCDESYSEPFELEEMQRPSGLYTSASPCCGSEAIHSGLQLGTLKFKKPTEELQGVNVHFLEVSPSRLMAVRRFHRRCNMQQGLNELMFATLNVEKSSWSSFGCQLA